MPTRLTVIVSACRRQYPRRHVGVLAFALGVIGVAACSSERPASPKKPLIGEIVLDVGDVVVTVSEAVPGDWQQRLAETYGTTRLRTAVWEALMRVAKLDRQSPRVLEIQVVRFRLRSTRLASSLAFWFGWMAVGMAGADYLDVKATVRDGSRTTREYTTGAATMGLFTTEDWDRFEKLARTVADRVAEQL